MWTATTSSAGPAIIRDIQMLDDKLDELTSDKDSLEKFAREQYYFHKKGEDVFIVD